MSGFTFLTEEQCFGDDKLEILRKRGTKAAITDFSILLGGYVSNENHDEHYYHIDNDSSLAGRTGNYWTKSDYYIYKDGSLDKQYMKSEYLFNGVHDINYYGNSSYNDARDRDIGARPALLFSEVGSIPTNGESCKRAKDGILEVEYGYYPQKAVSKDMQEMLEKEYKNGTILETKNNYTTDSASVVYGEEMPFQPQIHQEYEYNGKNYVRVKANSDFADEFELFGEDDKFQLSNGESYKDGDIVWVEVQPVKWLVDEEAHIMITEKIIFAGVQFNKENNYYTEDFDKTNIKTFMDRYFAKDLEQYKNTIETDIAEYKKNFLYRNDFIKLVNNDKIWSKSMNLVEIKQLLEYLENEISKHDFDTDTNFIMNGRRIALKEQIERGLSKNYSNTNEIVSDSLFNFVEFVSDEYSGIRNLTKELRLSTQEILTMDDEYRKKGIICIQERDVILEIINTIKKSISDFTFLTKEQCFGDNQLEILKKRGTKAAITDFSILLGGYVSPDNYIDNDRSLEGRTGNYWTKSAYYIDDSSSDKKDLKDDVLRNGIYVVGVNGIMHNSSELHRIIGARPALPFFEVSSIPTNGESCKRAKDGILEVEYGYYPQKAVSKDMQEILERKYNNGTILRTKNDYTTDSIAIVYETTPFQARGHIEYEYKGKKYVRIEANPFYGDDMLGIFHKEKYSLSNGESYKNGDIVWVEVQPVKWLVDEKSHIMITEKIIFAGVQFNKDNNYYTEDFDKTNIKAFMDRYLSKEITQSIK